ncbi:MAG: hypothetical protein GEU94_05765 [Micromonosporaceae bacterium]|nr:hypothetical protein [Micromonosporaceae bacterium]
MGCSHAATCPLFPLLNASLRSWRDYYCDTEDRWLDCARYRVAVTGRPVPITLLPNGHEAKLLQHAPGAPGAEPGRAPRQVPPSGSGFGPPETMARRTPGQTPPAQQFRPAPLQPRPYLPENPPVRPRPGQQAPGSKRRWWHRLFDWMSDPV